MNPTDRLASPYAKTEIRIVAIGTVLLAGTVYALCNIVAAAIVMLIGVTICVGLACLATE